VWERDREREKMCVCVIRVHVCRGVCVCVFGSILPPSIKAPRRTSTHIHTRTKQHPHTLPHKHKHTHTHSSLSLSLPLAHTHTQLSPGGEELLGRASNGLQEMQYPLPQETRIEKLVDDDLMFYVLFVCFILRFIYLF
jgi:hypothetical protein